MKKTKTKVEPIQEKKPKKPKTTKNVARDVNAEIEVDISKFIFKVTHGKDYALYGSNEHMVIYETEDQPEEGETRVATVVAPFGCLIANHTDTLDNFGSLTVFDPFSPYAFSLSNKIFPF